MSDSLLDLGVDSDIFTSEPDWSSEPSASFLQGRDIQQYDNGTVNIREKSIYKPRTVEYSFTNMTKSDEYSILDFFYRMKGMLKRFWVPIWKQGFTLSEPISSGSFYFKINNNSFGDIVNFHERIFIKTVSGDLITRKIAEYEVGSKTEFLVSSAWDRDIALSDIAFFGILLLARFDHDELEIDYSNDIIGTCSLRFLELVNEYDLQYSGS